MMPYTGVAQLYTDLVFSQVVPLFPHDTVVYIGNPRSPPNHLMITLPLLKLPLMPTLEPSSFPTIPRILLPKMLIPLLPIRLPILPLALPTPPTALICSGDLGQPETLGHFEEDVDGVVDAAEEFLAGTHGEDGYVSQGVDALVCVRERGKMLVDVRKMREGVN